MPYAYPMLLTFSKVRALVHFLCKAPVERTFQNLHRALGGLAPLLPDEGATSTRCGVPLSPGARGKGDFSLRGVPVRPVRRTALADIRKSQCHTVHFLGKATMERTFQNVCAPHGAGRHAHRSALWYLSYIKILLFEGRQWREEIIQAV